MISFAFVQLSKKHTEIFGTFIEIMKKNNWNFYIYYNKDDDPYTFLNYYENLFNIKLNIRKGSSLYKHKKDHDYFIFTSSADDKRISDYFKDPHMANKCIFVNHQAPHWKSYMLKNIVVSPLITSNEMDSVKTSCIVPFYREYKKLHSNYKKNNFAVVGAIRHQDKDVNLLTNLLKNFPDENFMIYIFMRKMDWRTISSRKPFLKNHPKILVFSGLNTEKMIEKLKEVKFILPLAKKDGWFHWQRLTGTIPLAVNLNIPLVLDKKLASIYGLEKVSLTYNNQITEIMNYILKISDKDYFKLIENSVLFKKKIANINNQSFLQICLSQVDNRKDFEF